MTNDDNPDLKKWNQRYGVPELLHGTQPSPYLKENVGLLPREGLALDIAAGEGQNAVFLAEHGLEVAALDISIRALEKCQRLARERGVSVAVAVVDLTEYTIPENTFDVIVNFNYLQRDLVPGIINGLKPGGVLVFETMTIHHLRWKPDFNPDYLLRPGELAQWCYGLRLMKYRETDLPSGQGMRSVASIIASKP